MARTMGRLLLGDEAILTDVQINVEVDTEGIPGPAYFIGIDELA